MAYKQEVTENGNSDSIQLFNGMYVLDVYAGTWGESTSVKIQRSPDGSHWHDFQSGGSDVDFTENGAIQIPGGGFYRAVVSDYSGSDSLVIRAQRISRTDVA